MNYFLLALIFIILIITAWALMGKGDSREDGAEVPPEKKFRRRATDQEIERAFPGEEPRQKGRRASDRQGAEGGAEEGEEPVGDLNLPFSVDEIISDTSRFRIYKRTLMNSEIYAKKGDYDTAISLYQGVNDRINDEATNKKIDANIAYLNNFRDFSEKRRKEKEEISKQFQAKRGNEIRVSIDGPLTIPDKIQIGIATPIQNIQKEKQVDIDKIVDEITSKLMSSDFFKQDSAARERERQLKQYINEVASLKEGVEKVLKSDKDLARGVPAGALEKEGGIISGIQEQLKKMEGRIEETARQSGIVRSEIDKMKEIEAAAVAAGVRIADKEPGVTAPRYTAPIPVTLDTRPIMELLDRLPKQNVPDAGPMKPPKGGGAGTGAAGGASGAAAGAAQGAGKAAGGAAGDASKTKEDIDREITTREGEEPEDFELFSEYLKDNKSTDEGISDADIFEKLLKEDQEKIQDSFEIRGDRKDPGGFFNLSDEEYEVKRRDEERFYEKFLRHEKRVRKELPILRVTYDFSRLPDELSLSKDKNILEYSLYKYKPLLEKADEFIRKRRVRDAINYYRTVMSQNVPAEFKAMIRKNISDLTEYLEKYLSSE